MHNPFSFSDSPVAWSNECAIAFVLLSAPPGCFKLAEAHECRRLFRRAFVSLCSTLVATSRFGADKGDAEDAVSALTISLLTVTLSPEAVAGAGPYLPPACMALRFLSSIQKHLGDTV